MPRTFDVTVSETTRVTYEVTLDDENATEEEVYQYVEEMDQDSLDVCEHEVQGSVRIVEDVVPTDEA